METLVLVKEEKSSVRDVHASSSFDGLGQNLSLQDKRQGMPVALCRLWVIVL